MRRQIAQLAALLTLAMHPNAAHSESKLLLAVLEFQQPSGAPVVRDRVYFSDLVRGVCRRSLPHFSIVSQENVERLLTASGKTLSDCEESCVVETGRFLGADRVVSGRFALIGGLRLRLSLHDTRTGELLGQEEARGDTAVELATDVEKKAAALASVELSPARLQLANIRPIDAASLPMPRVALDVDPELLIAFDRAVQVDRTGNEHPRDAARAWDAILQRPDATDAQRALAKTRSVAWHELASKQDQAQKAQVEFESRRRQDLEGVSKILRLESVSREQKLAFVARLEEAYGPIAQLLYGTPPLLSAPDAEDFEKRLLELGREDIHWVAVATNSRTAVRRRLSGTVFVGGTPASLETWARKLPCRLPTLSELRAVSDVVHPQDFELVADAQGYAGFTPAGAPAELNNRRVGWRCATDSAPTP